MTSSVIKKECIRNIENWSKVKVSHKFDNPAFSVDSVLEDLDHYGPKLKTIMEKIKELDERDQKEYGHTFKHFIYTDQKSAYGTKIIASVLISYGFKHIYTVRDGKFVLNNDVKGKSNKFAVLSSRLVYGKPIGERFKKSLLNVFNSRPDNVNGDKLRIVVLDSGFREGVDLFDVKYGHIVEPLMTMSQYKQVIGRGTRYCGQKGLPFDTESGWPLHIYKYQTMLPDSVKQYIPFKSNSLFDILTECDKSDAHKQGLLQDMEETIIYSAVDKLLTKSIHMDKKRKATDLQKDVRNMFKKDMWRKLKMENRCETPVSKTAAQIEFSKTQDFVRHYFTPSLKQKGMLLMHSVGTGKTCTAIATASSSFEQEDYTVIYVTRHTLKSDVWKNMFDQSCSVLLQGIDIPEDRQKRMKLIEKSWMNPMSYKQFSNMLKGKNSLSSELIKRNGERDMLKKTLVIIDEAHKLFETGGNPHEKPDVDAIRDKFHRSYEVSKENSVKVLLMTATPYSDDAMDFVRLMNLIKEKREQMPEDHGEFSKVFKLNEKGKFTKTGKKRFVNAIDGYISYLNRAMDKTSFAQPIMYNINVPMGGDQDNVGNEIEYIKKSIELSKDFKKNFSDLKILKRQYKSCQNKLQKQIDKCKDNNDCLSRINYQECFAIRDALRNEEENIRIEDMGIRFDKWRLKELQKSNKEESNRLSECITGLPKTMPSSSTTTTIPESGSPVVNLPIYTIMGHGNEKFVKFSDRTLVPQDTYLVTFSKTGRVVWLSTICKFMEIYTNPKYRHIVQDPLKYKKYIESHCQCEINVYSPGDKMPVLHTTLLLNFKKNTMFSKSGVYNYDRLPKLNPNIFDLSDTGCSGLLGKAKSLTDEVKKDIYKGNIYDVKPHNKLNDIVNTVGKGVYYFVACRAWDGPVNSIDHRDVSQNSIKQQKKRK